MRDQCSKCGGPNTGAHYSYCKACFAAYVKARTPRKERKRPTADEVRENARKRSLRWARKMADKQKAERLAVKAATPRICEECGASIPPEKRADAKCCSKLCTQRKVGREWWRAKHPLAKRVEKPDHPKTQRDIEARRRAAKRNPGAEYIVAAAVLERHQGLCGICGDRVDPSMFHVDHIVPLARGGSHTYANVQPAHPACNHRKGVRLPEEMVA